MLALTGFYPKLKSYWPCSHMNCCQHNMLHINLHIVYIQFIQLNLNLKEFQESINCFKSYQVYKIRYVVQFKFTFKFEYQTSVLRYVSHM